MVGAHVCVSREFRAFAMIGIDFCFTGGFALAAAADGSILAPVLSETSLPLPLTCAQRTDPAVSEEEMQQVVQRTRNDGLCVLGLGFSEDRMAPNERSRH